MCYVFDCGGGSTRDCVCFAGNEYVWCSNCGIGRRCSDGNALPAKSERSSDGNALPAKSERRWKKQFLSKTMVGSEVDAEELSETEKINTYHIFEAGCTLLAWTSFL